jgi:MFS family permease
VITRAAQQRGAVRPLTRAGIWVLFVLALLNGVFLYFLPGRAGTDYAWRIVPPVNAAFMGAGFVAGTFATGLVLLAATRWRSFQTLPGALWVLATTLAIATLIHHDKFKFHYLPTWGWVVVYAAVPFAVPALVALQRAGAEPEPYADPELRPTRIVSAVLGGVLVIGSAILYLFPSARSHWPWALTPLLARAVAAWYAMVGTMLVSCALSLRRASEAAIPYATLAAWSLLLLALPVLHAEDVERSGAAFAIWTALMIALLALSGLALSKALPALRSQPL